MILNFHFRNDLIFECFFGVFVGSPKMRKWRDLKLDRSLHFYWWQKNNPKNEFAYFIQTSRNLRILVEPAEKYKVLQNLEIFRYPVRRFVPSYVPFRYSRRF